MATFGISMVRDEADIVSSTVANMLTQVDHVIVADNGSTDGTLDILHELGVEVIDDPERGYYQSAKMTALAAHAADAGADWVVPFDADEWWYTPHHLTIADHLATIGPQWLTVTADLYDHVATGLDPDHPDPVARIQHRRRDRAPLRKVACRTRSDLIIHQGNHGATYDGGATEQPGLIVRHFPYRSAEQFVTKARNGAEAYAATDLPVTEGQHWRQYGALLEAHGPEVLMDVFRQWFWQAGADGLVFDPCLSL
jgi:glycosyltransferase involved in cell wall biosynthesis